MRGTWRAAQACDQPCPTSFGVPCGDRGLCGVALGTERGVAASAPCACFATTGVGFVDAYSGAACDTYRYEVLWNTAAAADSANGTLGGGVSPVGGHFSAAGLAAQLAAAAQIKLPTLALILLPTAFIALRSPIAAAAVPSLLLRFVSTNSSYWTTDWHYNATVMPIVFLAAIDAMARIRGARAARGPGGALAGAIDRHGAAVMLAICAALAFQFPLSTLWDPATYRVGPHVAAARAAMARVPGGATVETDLDLLAPLAARADTFWLGNTGKPGHGVHRVRHGQHRLAAAAAQRARVRREPQSRRALSPDLSK